MHSKLKNEKILRHLREEAAYYFTALGLHDVFRPELQISISAEDPEVPDPDFDDAFRLQLKDGILHIQGSNARSCLIAFYRFLYELGCRFPRPGRRYEILPQAIRLPDEMHITEAADYRHRGVCIEGSDSLENVLDFIDWLPKVYCNSFFLQFFYPYDFLKKWYRHNNNPLIKAEDYSFAKHLLHNEQIVEALACRGIVQQRAGHGWTAQALGYEGLGWDKSESEEAVKTNLSRAAQIDGKRGLFGDIPVMTNLCLANEEARSALAEAVADYAEQNRETDVLHVWLADSLNSVCECEECQKTTLADQYVILLNELDELLTARGLDTRICFLLYLDLLWPPLKEKLKRPERFILMFAPISRTFESSLKTSDYPPKEAMPSYQRNKNVLPVNVAENLTFLYAWQQREKTDSFIYDYPLGRAHYGDLGYMKIARVISEDVSRLEHLGLNGYISCQELRCALPSALPDYILGHKLWAKNCPTEDLIDSYFAACYGEDGPNIKASLEALSELSDTDYVNGKFPPENKAFALSFRQGEKEAAKLEHYLAESLKQARPLKRRLYLEELRIYAGYAERMFRALALRAGQDVPPGELAKAWADTCLYLQENELRCQSGFDVYRLIDVAVHYTKMPYYPEPFAGYDRQMCRASQ